MSVPAAGAWSSGFTPDTVPVELLDVDAAYGKVAVMREALDVTETASFQVAEIAGDAAIAACANATAAAVACHSRASGTGRVSLRLVLPGGHDARIVAEVRHRNAGSSVRQTWEGVRIHLAADTTVDGRHVAVCTGALNNYLVVRTRRGETVDAFALDDALALWQHFGMDREPLLSRMAVVERRTAPCGAILHLRDPCAPVGGADRARRPRLRVAVARLAAAERADGRHTGGHCARSPTPPRRGRSRRRRVPRDHRDDRSRVSPYRS